MGTIASHVSIIKNVLHNPVSSCLNSTDLIQVDLRLFVFHILDANCRYMERE